MGPPQGRAGREENLPRPAAHTPPNAPQDPIGFLGSQGTLLAHDHLVTHQDSQVPLCRAALQQVRPKPVLMHGVVSAQVQDPALALLAMLWWEMKSCHLLHLAINQQQPPPSEALIRVRSWAPGWDAVVYMTVLCAVGFTRGFCRCFLKMHIARIVLLMKRGTQVKRCRSASV